jgi:acyl-coenzyme A synthetase/AMP-(fatty) acid ligase
LKQYRVTHLFLPPTAFYALLAHPDVSKFDYSSLRVFLLAGSPVSPDKLKQGVEVFGPCMCQSYGQTEAPMLLTFLDARTVAAAAAAIIRNVCAVAEDPRRRFVSPSWTMPAGFFLLTSPEKS